MGEHPERLPQAAAELVGLPVDVPATVGTPASLAAQQATNSIPIVMIGVGYPVETGLVASLARPGGNITGVATAGGTLTAKKLELRHEIAPGATRVAFFLNGGNQANRLGLEEARDAVPALGLRLQVMDVRAADQLEPAFTSAQAWPADALYFSLAPLFQGLAPRIAELVAQARLPAMFSSSEYVVAGGLMAYGPHRTYVHRLPPLMWTRFCGERTPQTCRSSDPLPSSSSSTSRRPGLSASASRPMWRRR